MKVSERIYSLMYKKGIRSGAALGKEIGVDRRTIQKWLNDISKPTGKYLDELCRFLDVEKEYILKGIELNNEKTVNETTKNNINHLKNDSEQKMELDVIKSRIEKLENEVNCLYKLLGSNLNTEDVKRGAG